MENLKLIVEDRVTYCEHKNEHVNIRIMTHPIFGKVISKTCDYAVTCRETKCEYKGSDTE